MAKKIHALLKSEREKDCVEHHFRWTGRIPCTGEYRCYMCGKTPEELANEARTCLACDIYDAVNEECQLTGKKQGKNDPACTNFRSHK
jgi:hypothetical protein